MTSAAMDYLGLPAGEGAGAARILRAMSAAQVLIHSLLAAGRADCSRIGTLPATSQAVIVFVDDGSPEQQRLRDTLRAAVEAELARAGGAASPIPCCGSQADVRSCGAYAEAKRRQVFVVLCDGKTPVRLPITLPRIDTNSETVSVIPIVPLAARTTFSPALGALSIWNAEFWNASVDETVPAILARAGLIVPRPRIFISYRQAETAALAAQLFDRLSHKNCDVFLDHFRIEAGVDFQLRLTEELGDKSMFVLLESPTILDSKWVRYEIAKATSLGIGRVALTLPNSKKSPQIAPTTRLDLVTADFSEPVFSAATTLVDASLDSVTTFILREHARALFWRRGSLQNSVTSALRYFGVANVEVDDFGAIRVFRTMASLTSLQPEYIVWLSPSPPGLPEFFDASTGCTAPAKGVVIGPSQTLAALRRRQTGWLANRASLRFIDEGFLRSAARRMAAGTLP